MDFLHLSHFQTRILPCLSPPQLSIIVWATREQRILAIKSTCCLWLVSLSIYSSRSISETYTRSNVKWRTEYRGGSLITDMQRHTQKRRKKEWNSVSENFFRFVSPCNTFKRKSKSRTDVFVLLLLRLSRRRLYLLFHSFMGTDKTGVDCLEEAKTIMASSIAVLVWIRSISTAQSRPLDHADCIIERRNRITGWGCWNSPHSSLSPSSLNPFECV